MSRLARRKFPGRRRITRVHALCDRWTRYLLLFWSGRIRQHQQRGIEMDTQRAEVALDRGIARDRHVLRLDDALARVVHREVERGFREAEVDRRVAEREAFDDADLRRGARAAERGV